MRTRFVLMLAVVFVLLSLASPGYSAPVAGLVIVPATPDYSSLPAFSSPRSCMLRLFVDEAYAGQKGGVAWILQNVSYQNFEGDVVLGTATQHIIVGPWVPFSLNGDVNVSESGSFTITFWLKEGLTVNMAEFCQTLWNGAWNLSLKP